MTQELIYTSAPKGLQLGSRGFCTVASTAGMSKPLADRLEALSGYKHLYPPGSESAHLNPVNYSFVTFKLGGKTYYVLSRIADAGLDHTQRSNKLAHHVVLEGSELPPAGPAWLMRQPGFFKEKWEGEPRTIESRRIPLSPDPGPRRCDAWKNVIGDAGWAGVLVESNELHSSVDANIVFNPPGGSSLELVEEAQSLLPSSKRWGATFSTYYSKLPPGVECHWRFLPRDSTDAVAARRSHGTLLVDLLTRSPVQAATDAVLAARTGKAYNRIPALNTSEPGLASPQAKVPRAGSPTRPDRVKELVFVAEVAGSTPPTLPLSPLSPLNQHDIQSLPMAKRPLWKVAAAIVVTLLCTATMLGFALLQFNADKKASGQRTLARSELTPNPPSIEVAGTDSAAPTLDTRSSDDNNSNAPGKPTNAHAPVDDANGVNTVPTSDKPSLKHGNIPAASPIPAPPELEPAIQLTPTLLDTNQFKVIPFPGISQKQNVEVTIGTVPLGVKLQMVGANLSKGKTPGGKNDDAPFGLFKNDDGAWTAKVSNQPVAELRIDGSPPRLALRWIYASDINESVLNEARSLGFVIRDEVSIPPRQCLLTFCEAENHKKWKAADISSFTLIPMPKWLQQYQEEDLAAKLVLAVNNSQVATGRASNDSPCILTGDELKGVGCKIEFLLTKEPACLRISLYDTTSNRHINLTDVKDREIKVRQQLLAKAIIEYATHPHPETKQELNSLLFGKYKIPLESLKTALRDLSLEQLQECLDDVRKVCGSRTNAESFEKDLKPHEQKFGDLQKLYALWDSMEVQGEVTRKLKTTGDGNDAEAVVLTVGNQSN